jgi:hypothetical protein
VKKAVTNRPAVDIKEWSDEMLLPIVRAWEELSSTCSLDDAARFFPLIARAMMSELVGEKRSRQEWERADIAVRRWERQKVRQESQSEGSPRTPGRPKGATKNVDELVPHFLTLRRFMRAKALLAGEKPMSDTQIAQAIAEDAIGSTLGKPEPYSGSTFVDDDGSVVDIEVMDSPPAGYYGASTDGLTRRILAKTQSSRQPPAKGAKKTPPKT